MTSPVRVLQIGTDLDLAAAVPDDAFEVVAEPTVEAGRDALDSAGHDCIVSGHDPPETDGLALLETVRETRPALPFVLVVEPDSDLDATEAVARGATDVVRRRPGTEQGVVLANRVRQFVAGPERGASDEERTDTSDRYESVVEKLPIGVFRTTIDGEFRDVNPAFVSLIDGDSTDDVMAGNAYDLYAGPDTADAFRETLESEGAIQDEEIKIRTLDGEETWISTTIRVVEANGQQYVEGICQDISERKERERTLRQKEERYRNLVEASPAPINLFDADGTSVWGNDAVLELLGLERREELQGRSIFDFIHPENREIATSELEKVIEDGETVGPTNFRLVRDDGEVRHVRVMTTAGWYEGERVGQALVVDVTELRETQERLRQNERRYRTLVEMSPDPILVHTDGEIVYANDAMVDLVGGEDRQHLLGMPITGVLSEDEHDDAIEAARSVQRGESEVTRYGRTVDTLDGGTRYIETTSRAIAYEGDPAVLTAIKDVTDRYRYEKMLTTLHDRTRAMARAEGRSGIAEVAVETSDELLDVDGSVFYEFGGGDTLAPLVWSTGTGPEDQPPSLSDGDPIWDAFVDGDLRILDGDALTDVEGSSALVMPVGTHGVLLAVSTDTIAPSQRQIAGLVMENLDAALDRAGREAQLRDRDRQLGRQNETLEQLNRLNEIIREINQTLVRSTTRGEVESGVCEQFAATEQYAFAWIAERDPGDGAVSQRQWSGVGPAFLDHFEGDESATPLRELVDAAFRTRSVQAAQNVLDDPEWTRHRSDALRYGYRSIAAVPVLRGTQLDSVLVIHADDGDIFDDHEQTVLAELGRTIGYALRNVERVDAVLTGNRTVVELAIDDERLLANRLASKLGATVEFVGAIPDDGDLRVFLRLSGVTEAAVGTRLEPLESVQSVRALSVEGPSGLYQLRMAVSPLVEALRECDARLESATAEEGTTRLTVTLPGEGSVRTLVESLRAAYPETELLARREQTGPVDTRETFRDRIVDQLTDKQLDALQTAHYGGFYEWPRAATSEELAATRDIAASTFQYHLRAAERKLIGELLGT